MARHTGPFNPSNFMQDIVFNRSDISTTYINSFTGGERIYCRLLTDCIWRNGRFCKSDKTWKSGKVDKLKHRQHIQKLYFVFISRSWWSLFEIKTKYHFWICWAVQFIHVSTFFSYTWIYVWNKKKIICGWVDLQLSILPNLNVLVIYIKPSSGLS